MNLISQILESEVFKNIKNIGILSILMAVVLLNYAFLCYYFLELWPTSRKIYQPRN